MKGYKVTTSILLVLVITSLLFAGCKDETELENFSVETNAEETTIAATTETTEPAETETSNSEEAESDKEVSTLYAGNDVEEAAPLTINFWQCDELDDERIMEIEDEEEAVARELFEKMFTISGETPDYTDSLEAYLTSSYEGNIRRIYNDFTSLGFTCEYKDFVPRLETFFNDGNKIGVIGYVVADMRGGHMPEDSYAIQVEYEAEYINQEWKISYLKYKSIFTEDSVFVYYEPGTNNTSIIFRGSQYLGWND